MKVAERLADLLEALTADGMNLGDLVLVGHSLGAHVAGVAAKRMNSTEKIGTIIGLDPASVGFKFDDTEKRLAQSDALYVQIIHTDVTKFGMALPMGHGEHTSLFNEYNLIRINCFFTADIYPNGGLHQPGCKKRSVFTTLFGKLFRIKGNIL